MAGVNGDEAVGRAAIHENDLQIDVRPQIHQD